MAIPLNRKLKLPPGHLGYSCLNGQAAKGVLELAGVTGPDYRGEIDYDSAVEGRKCVSGIQELP